jgi:tRNA (guanine37-N1)-methyltransferase
MHIVFISLFPEIFTPYLQTSILGRALEKGLFSFSTVNPRDFATDKHKSVDDRPFGGGAGMVMRADILEKALLTAFERQRLDIKNYDRLHHQVLVMSAGGEVFTQRKARNYANLDTLFFICGHYEGIDQRFIHQYADGELSIGQYVLTGGELPALAITDSIVRLIPGAVGDELSTEEESYSLESNDKLLVEYPHYTRPAVFNGMAVPEVLVNGNHAEIRKWRLQQAKERTNH